MEEIRYIPGTGKAYGCDKLGNIYSYYLKEARGKISNIPQRILIPYRGGNNEYQMVNISLDGVSYNRLIHRLVAITWIDNPNNFPEVDHIDNNVYNNKVDNLRWCDRQFNVSRQENDKGALNGLRSNAKLYRESDNSFIAEFHSISSACQYAYDNFGCSKSGMQKYHKSKGYYIIADNEEKRKKQGEKNKNAWELYSPENVFIGTFSSKTLAGKYIKENIRDISLKRFSDRGKAYGYYVIQKSVETN